MSTDYRPLCAELTQALKQLQDRLEEHYRPGEVLAVELDMSARLLDRACAELARPEAKWRPKSLSPEALELWDQADANIEACMQRIRVMCELKTTRRATHALATETRALLDQPEPVALTDEFLIGLMPTNLLADEEDALVAMRAAVAAAARLGAPAIKPVALTDEESDAFAIVQMRLDDLAGDQELMIYRWPNWGWDINHTNPESSVQLGEASGVYGATGSTLGEVVRKLAALLSANNTREEN
jgi:hypothetical protein